MKLDKSFIRNQIDKSFVKGYLMIIDHRNNTIILKDGIFVVNDLEQPKSTDSITSILLEAFKLSRKVQIEEDIYIRTNSKWTKQF